MSYALNFIMSTIMQANPHPINFNRNHDILSIKELRRFVDVFVRNPATWKIWYSKTCVKRPLKNRQNRNLKDKW